MPLVEEVHSVAGTAVKAVGVDQSYADRLVSVDPGSCGAGEGLVRARMAAR